jgi:gluconolactonase
MPSKNLSHFIESAAPEKVADGFEFVEGPVWRPDGCLIFSDIPMNRQYKWTAPGACEIFREPSDNSNGLTLDLEGNLLCCEHGSRRVTRVVGNTVETVAESYGGKRLNSPNDIVMRGDGTIFFTDPPYGVKEKDRELDFQGVYALAPGSAEPKLLVKDFNRPNGLALSPDESVLYVDDTNELVIRAFDVADDGALSNDRVFAELKDDKPGVPDGLKVDREGNVYCTGSGGVWIFQPGGTFAGRIDMPEVTANVAFGGDDAKTLFMTASTGLYRVRTKIPGIGPAWR